MRVISWALAACVLLGLAGVFMPALEARVAGISLGKRTTHSLYSIASHRATAERLIAAYSRVRDRHYGEALAAELLPHLHARTHDAVDDVSSAMTSLDGVSTDDIRTGGRVLVGALVAFVVLSLATAVIVLRQSHREQWRRSRLLFAALLALVAAAIGCGMYVVCREAAFEANDEIGAQLLVLGNGTFTLAFGALGVLAGALALVGLAFRPSVRAATRSPARPS